MVSRPRVSELPGPGTLLAPEPRLKSNAWFRVGIAALLVGIFLAIRLIKALLWPDGGHEPAGLWDQVVRWGAIGWAVLLPWALADLAGWFMYRRHTEASAEARSGHSSVTMTTEVAFRVVTRGDQPQVVRATVSNIGATMGARPLFPFRIEVVTDVPVDGIDSLRHVTQLVVPAGYQTSNAATHKARALNYAMDASTLSDESWILHLDEESHITEELVIGIRDAVLEEELTGEHRIGQGLILYHRDIDSNAFLTLADSIRVGDDMGRFHLQYRLGRVLFGMHGSFVLVRNSVEKEVGFDFTPEGCITEDTTWGLAQMNRGRRFRWVDGPVVEQSPRRVSDFIKQRRRWFTGMWWGALHAPTLLRYRVLLIVSMAMWSVAWFNLLYSWVHLFNGVAPAPWIALLGDFIFTVYLANYLLGVWTSLARTAMPLSTRLGYSALQVVLLPLHALIEAAAIGFAFLKPERAFHVVAK